MELKQVYDDHQGELVEFSGPLLSQPKRIDEFLEKHERRIRQAVRRSWFQRGRFAILRIYNALYLIEILEIFDLYYYRTFYSYKVLLVDNP